MGVARDGSTGCTGLSSVAVEFLHISKRARPPGGKVPAGAEVSIPGSLNVGAFYRLGEPTREYFRSRMELSL